MLRDGIWPEGVYNVMFGLKFEKYSVECLKKKLLLLGEKTLLNSQIQSKLILNDWLELILAPEDVLARVS